MSGNFPEGFPGFQARLDAVAEAAGGDDLARMAAEFAFAEELAAAVRRRQSEEGKPIRIPFVMPHRGEWIRATAGDFEAAATAAELRFFFDDEDAPDLSGIERFKLLWGGRAIVRATRKAGILLAERRGKTVTVSAAGSALASANRHPFRSLYRHFGSEEAASAAFARWAEREFRI